MSTPTGELQRFTPLTYSVADLLDWYRNETLVLNPVFQRRSIWKPRAKSFLIDTILRGLPIPAIILRDLPPNLDTLKRHREVVDGQQRLRCLMSFILPDDELTGSDTFTINKVHQPDYKNFTFAMLPAECRSAILGYRLHAHVLPTSTTTKEVLDIFARLNATATNLHPQELRNSQYYGYFKTVSYAIAANSLEFYLRRKLFTLASTTRMKEVEFTSELILYILDGVTGLNQKSIDTAYEMHDDNEAIAKFAPFQIGAVFGFLDEGFDFGKFPVFSRTSLFYPLFVVTHELLFSKFETTKTRKVQHKTWEEILHRASRFQAGNLPAKVRGSMESQPTNARERSILTDFLRTGK